MAAGKPDYYRGVDISYQELAQVIVRPKHGGALYLSGQKAVSANSETTLLDVSGKGMIYGGSVWLDYTLTQADGEILIGNDASSILSPSFLRMNDYGILNPRSSVITLNKYDAVNYIYCVGLSYGITFESAFALGYIENNGTTPTVHYNLVYTLI